MSNPFFANSLKQSQQMGTESSHSPVAPRDSGTPIRESRLSNISNQQPRRSNNADTPTLTNAKSMNNNGQAPVLKQSSFGSVIYDSNRKTRDSMNNDEH